MRCSSLNFNIYLRRYPKYTLDDCTDPNRQCDVCRRNEFLSFLENNAAAGAVVTQTILPVLGRLVDETDLSDADKEVLKEVSQDEYPGLMMLGLQITCDWIYSTYTNPDP